MIRKALERSFYSLGLGEPGSFRRRLGRGARSGSCGVADGWVGVVLDGTRRSAARGGAHCPRTCRKWGSAANIKIPLAAITFFVIQCIAFRGIVKSTQAASTRNERRGRQPHNTTTYGKPAPARASTLIGRPVSSRRSFTPDRSEFRLYKCRQQVADR